MSNKTYDILKWIAQIFIPAIRHTILCTSWHMEIATCRGNCWNTYSH